MKRLTTEEFIEKARKVHGDKYDYSKVNYINSRTKVCIICKIHGEFWQSPSEHLRGCGCRKCCKNYSGKDYFIEKAVQIHGNKYDYSKINYINKKTKVCIICPEHGEFWQTPDSHINARSGCPKCAVLHQANELRSSTSEFIQKAINVHGDKYDYSKTEYITCHNPVIIICPKHGEFKQLPSDHLNGSGCPECSGHKHYTTEEFTNKANLVHNYKYKYLFPYIDCRHKLKILCKEHGEFEQLPPAHLRGAGCPMCARKENGLKCRSNTQEFVEKAKIIHKNYYDYSLVNYVSEVTPVKIICPVHGEFEQKPSIHLSGCGCKKCKLKSQTKVYNKIKEAFPQLKFIFEATNKHIPWAGKYRFDIYNKEYKFIIEYDGELHFISKEIFGGQEKLELRQLYDKEKDLLCFENKHKLFRLKYNYTEEDFNNLVKNINLILNQC